MFNQKEFKGLILLAIIILLFSGISALRFIKIKNPQRKQINQIELVMSSNLDSFSIRKSTVDKYKTTYENNSDPIHMDMKFSYFDPNKVNRDELLSMGLNENAVNNMLKYREKGGVFYKKEDLKRIYGISQSTYMAMEDFIIIEEKKYVERKVDTDHDYKNKFNKDTNYYKSNVHLSHEKISIDLNFTNEDELTKLNGIGEVLSKRIIKYRDLLGGFVKIEQLKEVYGLPEETYENIKDQIVIDTKMMKKIRINHIDQDALSEFPYINKKQSQTIINYRNQHGNFKDINDIFNIKSFDKEFIEKIEPYLDFRE